jgi:hypothetical protein
MSTSIESISNHAKGGSVMTITHQEEGRKERPDYANRHRQLEWRTRWFHLDRTSDDRELEDIFNIALDHKRKLVKGQRNRWRTIVATALGRTGKSHHWVSGHCAKRTEYPICRYGGMDSRLCSGWSRCGRLRFDRCRNNLDTACRCGRQTNRACSRFADQCEHRVCRRR